MDPVGYPLQVRKPEHAWETRKWRAIRRAEAPTGWSAGAQGFDLYGGSEGVAAGEAVFGREAQQIARHLVAADPDLLYAAKTWVAARGGRELRVVDESGVLYHAESFTIASLGDPDGRAERLVTLAPSNAELVDSLGCFGRVIACEDSSDDPPEVARCERLGPDLGPDLDRIAALGPDLVLSSLTVPGMERVVTGLRARGVPQRVLAPRTLDEVAAEVERVGEDLGVAARGAEVAAAFRAELALMRAWRPARRVRIYLEWWPRPMFTPGAACFSNGLIELAGGVNVFADRPGASVEITPAELVAADPELCFVSWCGVRRDKLDPSNLIRRPGLEALAAARAGRVLPLDERFAGRPGPRVLEAARIMAAAVRGII